MQWKTKHVFNVDSLTLLPPNINDFINLPRIGNASIKLVTTTVAQYDIRLQFKILPKKPVKTMIKYTSIPVNQNVFFPLPM